MTCVKIWYDALTQVVRLKVYRVCEHKMKVLPIEVKSGKHYERHRALTHIMEVGEYGLDEALVFTDDSVSRKGKIWYLPVYQVMFLEKDILPEAMVYELPPLAEGVLSSP